MSSLTDTLTASGGTESAGFLNDIISHLWPNINVAGCRMVKDIVEPMFAQMLPGPLKSLHFVKLDLGKVPLKVSNVDVHKTDKEGIKLDMDVDWDGRCDIELDGKMIPKMGIEHIKLKGRLSVLMCPITDVIPLIGALQVAFINPPSLKLDFTDAISIADIDMIENSIKKVILNIIGGMAVLPNRYLVKMNSNNDYFKTFVPHVGMIRITVECATGINGPKKSGVKKLLDKIAKDIPDCYCKVSVGAEEPWRTSTVKNKHDPQWNETHDFLVMDHDQCILIDVNDEDTDSDDDIGIALTTVRQLLLSNGTQELDLTHRGQPTGAKARVHAKFFNLVLDAGNLSAQGAEGKDAICGVANVLVAGADGLEGRKEDLNPSVKVTWGDKTFNTAAKTYTPGTDIFSPDFDTAFTVPITSAMLENPGSFKISLMNKTEETGSKEISFQDVVNAPDMTLEDSFDIGSGQTVKAGIVLRGVQAAH
ncbi:hypothetical protein F5Y15DRAFT_407281 [Xylariaceae sp. FL0016]|nr:hypothetical protein F5Y15DRAFT_407281 [Xylariaceae sp. FL0016]